MPTTYEPIATQTLGSAAASVTFSSIPATYTDLVLICNGTAASNTGLTLRFNGDTTSNYSMTVLEGSGSAAVSERQTSVTQARFVWNSVWNSTTPGVVILNIMNYANTTTFKTVLWRSSTSSNYVEAGVNLWRKTPEAINTFIIEKTSANIAAGSTFTLYGIKSA
jgi:hypothetical protein